MVGLLGLGQGVTALSSPIAADGLLLVASDNPGAALNACRPQSP
jgi:hypothetical protein